MEIKTIGNVPISLASFQNMLDKLGMKDVEGKIFFCENEAKRDLHPKYFVNQFKNNRQYRAYCFMPEKSIYVFLNEGETMESLHWLLAHELTHFNMRSNSFLGLCCNVSMRKMLHSMGLTWDNFMEDYDKYVEDDSFHENILEEQICNNFASTLIGADFGRKWWREQLKELDAA